MAKKRDKERLFDAVEKSYRDWDSFRKVNKSLVEEYAGDSFRSTSPAGGGRREKIVNLLHQTVSVYMMALAANAPKVLVDTRRSELRGFARHFQLALNNLVADIGLIRTIRRWVLDSYFSIGIVKAHMGDSGLVQIEKDVYADPGFPFASNVSLDNFVVDTTAKKWSEVEFIGDVYRIPFDDLQDADVWNQEAVKNIRPSSKMETSEDRLENIGKGYDVDVDEYRPMVDLIDLWLPREGKIVTYACDFRHGDLKPYGEPLAEMEWEGGELGNYHILGFDEVPENLMMIGPATHLAPLDKHINNVYRKQVRSARDMKEVQTYTPGGEKSARNLQNANHGDMVCVQEGNEVGSVRMGGVDQNAQMFLLNMMDHLNMLAGNPSALAGLAPQSDTLGQDRLIHGAVGGRVAQMGNRVNECVTELIVDLARLLWNDDVNTIFGEQKLEGLDGYYAQSNWVPGDREGDFGDYVITVDIASMPYKSTADVSSAILQLITQVYAPLMDQLVAQGGSIDMYQLNELLSELLNLPRLKDVIRFTTPLDPQMMQDRGGGSKPSNSTREYVRRSAGSGASGQSASQQAWASAASSNGS